MKNKHIADAAQQMVTTLKKPSGLLNFLCDGMSTWPDSKSVKYGDLREYLRLHVDSFVLPWMEGLDPVQTFYNGIEQMHSAYHADGYLKLLEETIKGANQQVFKGCYNDLEFAEYNAVLSCLFTIQQALINYKTEPEKD